MKEMISVDHEISMSSLDFLNNIINPARAEAGEVPHEPRKFLAKIEDELGEFNSCGPAVRVAKNLGYTRVNGCYWCCGDCHTS